MTAAVPNPSIPPNPPASGSAVDFRSLAFLAAPLCLIGAWLCTRLRYEWTYNVQYAYGWAVPFLCAYLFWRRWETRPEPSPPADPRLLLRPALPLLLAWLPLRWVQETAPDWRPISWALALSSVGLMLLWIQACGGKPWRRHFLFPIAFLLVGVPWLFQFEFWLVQTLTAWNVRVAVEVLDLFGIAAIPSGNVIEIGSGMVGVDEACSGIRSLQATVMLALFFGERSRLTIGRRLKLLVGGTLLAMVGNLGRTLTLVWIGDRKGLEALERWHDLTGVSILLVVFVGLAVAASRLERQQPGAAAPSSPGPATGTLPVSPLLLRHATVLALAGVVAAEAASEGWYRWRESGRPRRTEWTLAWDRIAAAPKDLEIPKATREILNYDDGRSVAWEGDAKTRWQMYYFRWNPGMSARYAHGHRPDICLPAAGRVLQQKRGIIPVTLGGVEFPFETYLFDDGGMKLTVFHCFWDERVGEIRTSDDPITRSTRLSEAWHGKRTFGLRVLEVGVWGYSTVEDATAALQRHLGQAIIPLSRP